MEFRVIRKLNKRLNAFSIVTLTIGVFSILVTANSNSGVLAIISMSLLVFGLMSLIISWAIKRWKTITINIEEISYLNINTTSGRDELTEIDVIEYLGNWLVLNDNRRIEIDRIHVIPLIKELNEDNISLKPTEQKFYNVSPKELFKFLGSLGP